MTSDIVCMLRHVRPFIGPFSARKLQKRIFFLKLKQLGMVLELVIQDHGKNWGHFKDVKEQSARRRSRTPYVEHGVLLNILEMTPTFASRWHAHGRNPCPQYFFQWVCMTNSRHQSKLLGFLTSFAFLKFSLSKRSINS